MIQENHVDNIEIGKSRFYIKIDHLLKNDINLIQKYKYIFTCIKLIELSILFYISYTIFSKFFKCIKDSEMKSHFICQLKKSKHVG